MKGKHRRPTKKERRTIEQILRASVRGVVMSYRYQAPHSNPKTPLFPAK